MADPQLTDSEFRTLTILVEADKRLTGGKAQFEANRETGEIRVTGITAADGIFHAFAAPIFVAKLTEAPVD